MTTDDKIRDEQLQHNNETEAAKISALPSGEIDKYEYLTGAEVLSFHQKRVIEQAKITYSPLGKALGKQTKTIEDEGRKQIDAKDDDENNYKETFEKLVKGRFDEVKKLTYEINHDDLTYYFKGDTDEKRSDKCNNDIKHFKKIQTGEMKLEEAKILQNVYQSNLNEISRERFK